jgi:hypothetical protein
MVTQSEDLYNQMIRHGLMVSYQVTANMQRDSIHGLRMALNCIREENNRMLIRLNCYVLQVRIRELCMYGDYQEA